MNAREEIFNLLRKTLCNGTTDCENYPECVNEGEMDGCPPLDLAQSILAKLPELGFVKLKDVDIDKEEIKWLIKGTAKILKKMGFVKLKDVEIDENEVGLLLYKTWNGFSEYEAKENWTAKHIQTESKIMCAKLARAITSAKPIKVKK